MNSDRGRCQLKRKLARASSACGKEQRLMKGDERRGMPAVPMQYSGGRRARRRPAVGASFGAASPGAVAGSTQLPPAQRAQAGGWGAGGLPRLRLCLSFKANIPAPDGLIHNADKQVIGCLCMAVSDRSPAL